MTCFFLLHRIYEYIIPKKIKYKNMIFLCSFQTFYKILFDISHFAMIIKATDIFLREIKNAVH